MKGSWCCLLAGFLGELHAKKIDLYLHQQGLDTSTPAGRAMFQMLGVFAEFERSMIRERVKAGMRRAKLEGQRIGRPLCQVDVAALVRDRERGHTVSQLANRYAIGQTTVRRLLRQAAAVPPKGSLQSPLQVAETNQPVSAV